ncbi:hypothetical protein DICVIV_07170 [Dictyocaulus viviparus]|uniref:Uncharacterized protein n=1 Tax=Dictyocaulus viviparus TaxID=29172 RepID=A0A0D8XSP1_DICVI|nr:hypothetical protein DICVIV_07170 [Dictyocaulus viviparus]
MIVNVFDFSVIMNTSTMFTLSNWLRSRKKLFQNRLVIAVLMMVNFGNSIIISLETFGNNFMLSFTTFIVNAIIVLMALYGIFAFKPIFVIPNVIAKVSMSSAALFHGMQEAESNNSKSIFHFIWLLISVCLYIWEIHAMFSTTFNIIKEMKQRSFSKPPPSYNQVIADEAPPPTYDQATAQIHKKSIILNVADLEMNVDQTYTSSPVEVV